MEYKSSKSLIRSSVSIVTEQKILAEYFYEDRSKITDKDPVLRELLQNEKVVLTGHQAFFTEEALRAIA